MKKNDLERKDASVDLGIGKTRQKIKVHENSDPLQGHGIFNSINKTPDYALFDQISSGIAVYEAVEGGKNFIIKDFNSAAEKIDHKSRIEVIGRRVTEVFPGIREIKLLETFRRVWKTGKPENHPITLYTDNVLTGWRENYVYKLPSGEIVAIYNDLTAVKKAEAYEKWLASFPEINPLLVLEIDEKLNIVYINPSVKKQFPDIEMNSAKHPFLAGLKDAINILKKEKKENTTVEVQIGDRWYSQIICSVSNSNNFRIYAYDITEKRKVELIQKILFEIIQAAVMTKDLPEFFNLLRNSIAQGIYADNIYVFLYDDKKGDYSVTYTSNKSESSFPILQMKKCLSKEEFQIKRSSLITKEQLKKLRRSANKNDPVPVSGICVPLKTQDQIIGVISLFDYEREDRFKKSDLRSFDLIAGQVAEIIQRKQAQVSLIKRNRMLRMLGETNKELVHITDEKELLNVVCEILVDRGGYRMAWIGYMQSDKDKSVVPVAGKGYEEGYLDSLKITWADAERGRGPTGTAIRTKKVSIARNILEDPEFKPWRKAAIKNGYKSSIAVPLFSNKESIGALNIYSDKPDAFDDEEVKLLTEMAGDLSYGISSIRIRDA